MSSDDKEAVEKRTRQAVTAYVGAWCDNDREALLAAFSDDAVWIDPVGTPPRRGKAEIAEFWDQAHAGGQELEPRVERLVVCSNEAILLFRMIIRSAGGGGMALDVCDHFEVDSAGRIAVAKAFWDESCSVALEEC